LTTGATYQVVGSSGAAEFHGSSSLPVAINRQVRFGFVGPGPGNNVRVLETTNIKIDANGETTVSITDATFDCPD
jgi:hypothetical protein